MRIQNCIEEIEDRMSTMTLQFSALKILAEKLGGFDFEVASIYPFEEYLDLNYLTRKQVEEVLSRLKLGIWEKEINGSVPSRINYVNATAFPGIKIRLYAAQPPETCELVEEDVVIPAQPAQPERIEKRVKLVCK